MKVIIRCYKWVSRLIMSLFQLSDEMGSTPELVLCPLGLVHQGHYICRVNHGENCIFSQWAQVCVIHSAGISPLLLLFVPLVLLPLMACDVMPS